MYVMIDENTGVHYEQVGRGRPVIFLHGWLGSWQYWEPAMSAAGQSFRAYSVDFLGFGYSSNRTQQSGIETYSRQVIQFMNALGIDQAMLVGHSMGGMVAMKTALDYPQRVQQVVTVGAPFEGSSLSWLLKLTRYRPIADAFARWPWVRRRAFAFFLGNNVGSSMNKILDDTLKSNAETLHYTVNSMLQTDLRPELPNLRVPALVIHGGRDDVVDPRQVDLFNSISSAAVVLLRDSRHFPFLEGDDLFNELLLRFLKQNLLAQQAMPVPMQPASAPLPSS